VTILISELGISMNDSNIVNFTLTEMSTFDLVLRVLFTVAIVCCFNLLGAAGTFFFGGMSNR